LERSAAGERRKAVGKTRAELAKVLDVSQSRISQVENGKIEAMELETLRADAIALGGHLDITVRVGPHSVTVARCCGYEPRVILVWWSGTSSS
jgi:transcriptional regulator with XRE-family HTH domain